MLTGGMDCQVVLWETARGKPLQDFSTNDPAAGAAMVNPPFVHGLSVHRSGMCAVAALGNADLAIYALQPRVEVRRVHGHASPVAAVYGCVTIFARRCVVGGSDQL